MLDSVHVLRLPMKSRRYLQLLLMLLLVLAQLIYVTHESMHLHDDSQACPICLHASSGDAALTTELTPLSACYLVIAWISHPVSPHFTLHPGYFYSARAPPFPRF